MHRSKLIAVILVTKLTAGSLQELIQIGSTQKIIKEANATIKQIDAAIARSKAVRKKADAEREESKIITKKADNAIARSEEWMRFIKVALGEIKARR